MVRSKTHTWPPAVGELRISVLALEDPVYLDSSDTSSSHHTFADASICLEREVADGKDQTWYVGLESQIKPASDNDLKCDNGL